MFTINDAEIKTAINATTSAQESGIKRMKIAGRKLRDNSDMATTYYVAIRHKVLDNDDNASVYEVFKNASGNVFAYFDGTFRVAKDGSLESCYDVHYGGFTNEMAREWLSEVFPEPVEEEEVEETEQAEEETAEVPSEAPAEPETVEEEVTMKDVDKAVHEAEDTTMSISETMDWMAKDLSKLEATILATGDESLIWYFNRCVRRTERVKARADKMFDKMCDISFFTRAESYKSA